MAIFASCVVVTVRQSYAFVHDILPILGLQSALIAIVALGMRWSTHILRSLPASFGDAPFGILRGSKHFTECGMSRCMRFKIREKPTLTMSHPPFKADSLRHSLRKHTKGSTNCIARSHVRPHLKRSGCTVFRVVARLRQVSTLRSLPRRPQASISAISARVDSTTISA